MIRNSFVNFQENQKKMCVKLKNILDCVRKNFEEANKNFKKTMRIFLENFNSRFRKNI